MRIAITGIGGAAERGHLPAIRALAAAGAARLVGAADPDPDRRARFAGMSGSVPTFARSGEMLAAVDPDLLVVATEPAAHPDLVALGLSEGRHVLCEKPLALSRRQLERLAAVRAELPAPALVPVHQYRFSPAWGWIGRGLRAADRHGRPFRLRVEVRRPGTDRHAASSWRDATRSGGMLIDHGAHFLALARTVSPELTVLGAERERAANGAERCVARLACGAGRLDLALDGGAERRETRIQASVAGAAVVWRDAAVRLDIRGKRVLRRRAAALSDRDHVDSLYLSLYRRMIESIGCPSWRQRRSAEAFGVAHAGISLLEAARQS